MDARQSMNEKQLLTHVRERAGLGSTDEARAATEATLRVLGSRITESEAEDLAAELPGSFGADLTRESDVEAEPFDVAEFVERVREREADDPRIDDGDPEAHAKAVASVLTDAVGGGELSDVRARLPDGYERLFDATET